AGGRRELVRVGPDRHHDLDVGLVADHVAHDVAEHARRHDDRGATGTGRDATATTTPTTGGGGEPTPADRQSENRSHEQVAYGFCAGNRKWEPEPTRAGRSDPWLGAVA